MQKTMSTFETRRQFGKVLDGVMARGDEVVVERHGEPVAAVVPMAVYERLVRGQREARARFFSAARQAAERAGLSDDEAQEVVANVIERVRAQHDAGQV